MAYTKGKCVVSAEITDELRDDLAKRAKAENRSKSRVISRAIAFYLAHAAIEKRQKTREDVAPIKQKA